MNEQEFLTEIVTAMVEFTTEKSLAIHSLDKVFASDLKTQIQKLVAQYSTNSKSKKSQKKSTTSASNLTS